MDDLIPYKDSFETPLVNLEKVLERCIQTNATLSIDKCRMMMNEGIVLEHFIFVNGIKVDTTKIEVILKILVPKMQKEVHSFLGHAGYYRRFIDFLFKNCFPFIFSSY